MEILLGESYLTIARPRRRLRFEQARRVGCAQDAVNRWRSHSRDTTLRAAGRTVPLIDLALDL